MNEFFGIDMTYIMIALLVVLFIALASVGYVVARNRIMFQVGVRNIPRRRAQTVLIIIGLMLSTLIISTALSFGDTVDYSVTSQTFSELRSIDEVVAARTDDGTSGTEEDEASDDGDPTVAIASIVSAFPIPTDQAQGFVRQFKEVEGVDGAIAVMRGPAPAVNEARGQAEPLTLIMGLPDDMTGFEEDIVSGGEQLAVTDLADNEIYASESAADELAIEPGDTVTFTVLDQRHQYVVKAIVEDTVLTGSVFGELWGFAMPLERAQEIFNRRGDVDFIAVSNDGGVREGVELSDDVNDRLNDVLLGTAWEAQTVKKDMVSFADTFASFVTTFFVVLGLFSISSGALLIFLIFVMLAAERKVEMGMVRAVGTKRSHLVQMFMSEGMVYNLVAAAVGCFLGVLVSIALVQVMANIFSDFGLQIEFNVTARSLIIAYSIGVVLTFLTVTFSSWRVGNLNIVSAIRDTADPVRTKEKPQGSVLRYILWVLFKPENWRQVFVALAMIVVGAILVAVGVGFFIGAGAVYDDTAVGGSLGVLLGVLGGLIIAAGAALLLIGFSSIFQLGPLMLIAGPFLILWGLGAKLAFPFGAGLSFVIVGAALLLRFLGAPARPVFTVMGLTMLFFWLVFAGNNVPGVEELEGDIDMFFLSGVTMVLAGTFVLVYNADLLLAGLNFVGRFFSSLVPSIRTAVAYPLANKFRTGMTVAMISLVMFALVMFSTMNSNFDRIFLSDDALAGYDVAVAENPGNPIDDLVAELQSAGFTTDGIAGADKLAEANPQVSRFRQLGVDAADTVEYDVVGMSDEFSANNQFTFQARVTGFETDEEVREALAENPNYAVISAFAVQGDFGGAGLLEGVDATDTTFEPITLEVFDSATRQREEVELIGVLSIAASGLFDGMFVSGQVFDEVYGRPLSTQHLVRLEEGADATDIAQGIERTLLAEGVQAESLRDVLDEYQAQSRGFLYLFQAFMGIGLFVGIAAVGVIAFRTVVERRQQIGMLRAIGYSRRAIALSFLMESSFTALLGIGSGIILGLLLAQQLVKTDDFVAGGVTSFYIPWVQILAIGAFAFVTSLLMTIIPSRQASSMPIAEALRYE